MRTAIIYWSGTGNTEAIGKAIFENISKVDNDTSIFNVSEFNVNTIDEYKKIILGCPSMGNEVLEESEFEPFYESIKGKLLGKKVAIFGSYGWGDGEWIRTWEADLNEMGVNLIDSPLAIHEAPNGEDFDKIKEFSDNIIK